MPVPGRETDPPCRKRECEIPAGAKSLCPFCLNKASLKGYNGKGSDN